MALKADIQLLASGTPLVGLTVQCHGLVYGEHQLRWYFTDTISPRIQFKSQLLQASLRGTVSRLVLAQKHHTRLSLFFFKQHSCFPSWEVELRMCIHPGIGREVLAMEVGCIHGNLNSLTYKCWGRDEGRSIDIKYHPLRRAAYRLYPYLREICNPSSSLIQNWFIFCFYSSTGTSFVYI